MTLRRSLPFWARKKNAVVVLDNSFDSLSFINQNNSIIDPLLLRRTSDTTEGLISWDGLYPDLNEIDAFIDAGANDNFVKNLYGQKNSTVNFFAGQDTGGTWPIFQRNGITTDKPCLYINNPVTNYLRIEGNFRSNIIKNIPYMAITMLVKHDGVTRANSQAFLYIGTASSGRLWCGIYSNANPATGGFVFGRRLSADTGWTATTTHNFTVWTVVTGIWDFENQDLIIRINGTQVGINTTFGTGGNSDNIDPFPNQIRFGGINSTSACSFQFGGSTFWNNRVDISEIVAFENTYKTLAGITP